ncbi:MAG: hypothetical protein COY58_09370 [Gammaproteobacteria bacterium CG_4_10_14_0_8_um_filter_38_16]|nr:MAG: hypothetical protein COY58_09370 [Gammaproteobacteria bacterium CG_4_10_14_0_8_um_filter_38_16]PJA03100.1 MAG: hypothetical protein COX72_07295 [Gammaproteobacteria bacterium CG_4_10_14_0_2_um_filter_38_22]PJB10280.1 MAG: hypothetical protein CO120_05610 [Gammaproteobacteria bacterium CG_4_9_14_3_um_filter_38_9]
MSRESSPEKQPLVPVDLRTEADSDSTKSAEKDWLIHSLDIYAVQTKTPFAVEDLITYIAEYITDKQSLSAFLRTNLKTYHSTIESANYLSRYVALFLYNRMDRLYPKMLYRTGKLKVSPPFEFYRELIEVAVLPSLREMRCVKQIASFEHIFRNPNSNPEIFKKFYNVFSNNKKDDDTLNEAYKKLFTKNLFMDKMLYEPVNLFFFLFIASSFFAICSFLCSSERTAFDFLLKRITVLCSLFFFFLPFFPVMVFFNSFFRNDNEKNRVSSEIAREREKWVRIKSSDDLSKIRSAFKLFSAKKDIVDLTVPPSQGEVAMLSAG